MSDDIATAVQHLETYWAILEKVKGSTLRLTKLDDEIYEHLCKDFPEFDPAEPIEEDKMKSPEGKKRWRAFMMAYEKKVDDYSFGTILRTDPKGEYTQDGTIFGECFGFPGARTACPQCVEWLKELVSSKSVGGLTPKQCLACSSTPLKSRGTGRV